MTDKGMEKRIEELEEKVRTLQALQDTEEIKKLQRAYGYYLEHWMSDEVIDCFADSPDCVLSLYEGTWLGKEGIRKYFGRNSEVSPEFLHQVMQLSPIVDVAPNGKTAKGRWYSWGCTAIPMGNGIRQSYMGGIYECEYIKQDGKWKILKLAYNLSMSFPPDKGWVRKKRLAETDRSQQGEYAGPKPDIAPHGMNSLYPSGYIFPFHYKHPVTGKETSEEKRNASLPYVPNLFAKE
jgi:hypothetical protein